MSEITLDAKDFQSNLSPGEVILLKVLYEQNKLFFRHYFKLYGTFIPSTLESLEKRFYLKIIGDDLSSLDSISLRQPAIDLFTKNETISFDEFWKKYHEVTKLPKTDLQAAKKYWNGLLVKDKKLAFDNVENYYNSLNDKRYCKKARTYLADKNYLDEWNIQQEKINRM